MIAYVKKDSFWAARKSKITIITSNHSTKVVNALNNIQEDFKGELITEEPKVVERFGEKAMIIRSQIDFCRSDHCGYAMKNTSSFQSAIEKLEHSLLKDEIAYYQKKSLYSKFKSSPFYQEVVEVFNKKNHPSDPITLSNYDGFQLYNSHFRAPDNVFDDRFTRSVYFKKYPNGILCDEVDKYYPLLKTKYRSLTPEELGLLAAALQEDFPNCTSVKWEYYLCYSDKRKSFSFLKDTYELRFQIIPVLNPKPASPPAPQKPPKPILRDLY